MFCIYKSTADGLQLQETYTSGCWVNVIDPSLAEIERLTSREIPYDWVINSLDLDERPRTEREDNGKIFILIRIPIYKGEAVDIPFQTIPLGIILADQCIITICKVQNDILQDFIGGRVKNLSTAKRNRFVLRLLLINATKFLFYLRDINRRVDIVEDKLQVSMKNQEMMDLLKYQKSLVYFTTALRTNELMMERLQRSQLFRMYPEDEDLLEDVINENQQAIEMVNISSNILTNMMDAFASIISNNLNVVMKFLASMTIVLSIPTIITSFYGMNVQLPFASMNTAYMIVIGMSFIAMAVIVFIFVKKHWF